MFTKNRKRHGATIVEFCLIIPVLFLILFAIFDFGNLFYQQISANQAAREASRVFSVTVNSMSTSAAITKATIAAQKYGSNSISFTYDSGSAVGSSDKISKGTNVTTTVTKSITIFTPILSSFFKPNPYPCKAKSTMEVEGS